MEARNDTREVRYLASQGFISEEARLFDFISACCSEGNSVRDPGGIFVRVHFLECNRPN
jgi:hypothetical protein